MKVGFNISPLKSDHSSRGIGSYTRNLLNYLKKEPEIKISEFSSLDELDKVDIIHYPFFDLFKTTLPFWKKCPTVVTIHDVIPLIFPSNYPPGFKGRLSLLIQRLSLKGVDAVITDSNSSKKDITKYFNYNSKKISTIFLAADESFKKINNFNLLKDIKNKYNLPELFVLYIGGVNYNKNIFNIAKATHLAGIDLVLVGENFKKTDGLNHPELANFKKFQESFVHDSKMHTLGFIPQEDLVIIMNLAKCLLLPSIYEGFGLEILEAQACGTPVVTSNNSSLMEVGGEGALYVDPYDFESIASVIRKIVSDKKLSQYLIEKGFKNNANFSWRKTAKETAKVYKIVLE